MDAERRRIAELIGPRRLVERRVERLRKPRRQKIGARLGAPDPAAQVIEIRFHRAAQYDRGRPSTCSAR